MAAAPSGAGSGATSGGGYGAGGYGGYSRGRSPNGGDYGAGGPYYGARGAPGIGDLPPPLRGSMMGAAGNTPGLQGPGASGFTGNGGRGVAGGPGGPSPGQLPRQSAPRRNVHEDGQYNQM